MTVWTDARTHRDVSCTVRSATTVKRTWLTSQPPQVKRHAVGSTVQCLSMLDLTVEYAKARQQFGVPIGSFQAVKHHLADSRIAIEFARPLVYRAAWSITEGDPDASTHVSMAKALASEAATLTAGQALQCHGAIGYSYEYDLHLFMKRAWALAATWGDAAWHRARVGRAIL